MECLPEPGTDRRALYERTLTACGVDPDEVLEVRIGEDMLEVDFVNFEDPTWPVITRTYPTTILRAVRSHRSTGGGSV